MNSKQAEENKGQGSIKLKTEIQIKINETEAGCLLKKKKKEIDKPLVRLTKIKREKTGIMNEIEYYHYRSHNH